ncbi:MAG TPA: alcohol dehydrogenase catalytic domain-containing protein [Planctomycetota bacterium]|nr:alcohol dehydrogenase catalytic domain-containing protein [Planctomycetota bacterium]
MKALVYTGPGKVEIQDVPRPVVQPGEVLLRNHSSGICGSDIHGFLGHSERRKPGLILGHETIATIEEAHPSVTAWKPGQKVIVNPLMTCGACAACLAGKQNLCANWKVLGLDRVHGTYAEFTAIPTGSLYPAPAGVSDEEAVLTEPLANVVHFFRISMTEVPDSLTILGAGPIGILALLMAKLRGIARVAIVDKNEERLAVAKKLRADHVIAAGKEDAVEAVRRWSDGGTDFVIETAGISATRRQAVDCARRGGRLLFIGMTENDSPLPWIEMIREEKSVFTTFCYTPKDFLTSLRLIESRQIDLRPWTETRPMADGQAGFDKIAHHPGSTLKMVFKV